MHAWLLPSTRAIFPRMKISRLRVGLVVGLGFAQLMAETPSPGRDINAVLAAHDRPETERKLPRQIEGYPVVTEISGEIRPLRP